MLRTSIVCGPGPCGGSRLQFVSLESKSRMGCNPSRTTCQAELLTLLIHWVNQPGIRAGPERSAARFRVVRAWEALSILEPTV